MPKYKVHVCRTAYSHLDIEVEANDPNQAIDKALNEAGDRSFPTETSSEYTEQGITELE